MKQKTKMERTRTLFFSVHFHILSSVVGLFEDDFSTASHVSLLNLMVVLSHQKISILKIYKHESIAFACWQWNRDSLCHFTCSFSHLVDSFCLLWMLLGMVNGSRLVLLRFLCCSSNSSFISAPFPFHSIHFSGSFSLGDTHTILFLLRIIEEHK
jgi:hypothetical protein